MRIRKIAERDKSNWISLRAQLWTRAEPARLREEADDILKDRKWRVFVAKHAGKLIGFIECSIRDKAPGCETNRIGYIEGWFIAPAFRNQGVGKKLVEQGEKWAKDLGCREMASDTTSDYPLSPKAHKALGYKEVKRKFFYRKELS
ncbi:MAG: GNAT family N-acetyltransferase [candidate division Zixibacteria bacterium]|nr:GNAT family N-acetyltransferase [candidate division Zixibacteria bacterium]